MRISVWSSDVCSSDLPEQQRQGLELPGPRRPQVKSVMPSEMTVAALFESYYDCRRAKRNTRAALTFEVNLEDNLMPLLRDLEAGTWQPAPATVFAITRPKPREVWAADFRDRIVHHLVYRAIAPLFEPSFIAGRSEEHTSELQSLMRISYAVFCLKNKKKNIYDPR